MEPPDAPETHDTAVRIMEVIDKATGAVVRVWRFDPMRAEEGVVEQSTAYYYFTHPNPRTGRPVKTRYRMTLEEAKERHGDTYTPILDSVEYRPVPSSKFNDFEPYKPGDITPNMPGYAEAMAKKHRT